MRVDMKQFQEAITAWTGVEASPHRFGGIEFTLGGTEIGHIHSNGMVDIPFNRKIRDELIAEGKAVPHHILNETGWITFYIRSEADVEAAVWLFRLSYLFYAARSQGRTVVGADLNIADELAALNMSQALQTIVDGLVVRR
jgi:hypothetical protein